jgi:hypothetical protein
MYVGISNILHPLLMAFVNSFRISQLYTSYTLVVVFCTKNNLHDCIVMLYSVCIYTVQLYIDIYYSVKQLLQSICEICFCSCVMTCFTLWLGPGNVRKFSSIIFYSTLTSFCHTLIRRPCTLYIVQLVQSLLAVLTKSLHFISITFDCQ